MGASDWRLVPLGARVLVRPAPRPPRSALLETVEYVPPVETAGTVLAVGTVTPCRLCGTAADLAVGDRVVFAPTAGQEVVLGEARYLLLQQSDILAVLESAHE